MQLHRANDMITTASELHEQSEIGSTGYNNYKYITLIKCKQK